MARKDLHLSTILFNWIDAYARENSFEFNSKNLKQATIQSFITNQLCLNFNSQEIISLINNEKSIGKNLKKLISNIYSAIYNGNSENNTKAAKRSSTAHITNHNSKQGEILEISEDELKNALKKFLENQDDPNIIRRVICNVYGKEPKNGILEFFLKSKNIKAKLKEYFNEILEGCDDKTLTAFLKKNLDREAASLETFYEEATSYFAEKNIDEKTVKKAFLSQPSLLHYTKERIQTSFEALEKILGADAKNYLDLLGYNSKSIAIAKQAADSGLFKGSNGQPYALSTILKKHLEQAKAYAESENIPLATSVENAAIPTPSKTLSNS